jgi:hypothetical protein
VKKAYVFTLLSTAACSSTSATWQSFKLDQRVSVRLPHQPQVVAANELPPHAGRLQVWRLFTAAGDYQVMRTAYLASNFSARDTAYDAQLVTDIQHLGPHGIVSRQCVIAGVKGQEVTYYTTTGAAHYVRYFTLDSVRYSAAFLPTQQLGLARAFSTQRRDEFFNSITINP